MMEKPVIESYCKIRDNRIVFDANIIFEGKKEDNFGDFIKDAYRNLNINYLKFFKMDNLSKLGFIAAEILMKENQVTSNFKPEEISIILSNSSSSLDTDEIFQETIKDKDNYFPSPSVFVYTLPNLMIGEICIRHKITGENTFFVFDKYNPDFIQNYVTVLFKSAKTKCCIIGWVELFRGKYEAILYLIKKEKDCIKTKEYSNFEADNLGNIWKS